MGRIGNDLHFGHSLLHQYFAWGSCLHYGIIFQLFIYRKTLPKRSIIYVILRREMVYALHDEKGKWCDSIAVPATVSLAFGRFLTTPATDDMLHWEGVRKTQVRRPAFS